MTSLPQAAFFLFLEAATGGAIALFWLHARGEVTRGFTLFTGIAYLVVGGLAIWIRTAFPPSVAIALSPAAQLWFNIERTLTIAFVVLFAIHLVLVARQRQAVPSFRILLPVVPLLALGALWSAALVDASQQLAGLGTPLAVLAGAVALGAALTGLSLGHWYLVSPSLSVKPLILVNFRCLGALLAQTALAAILLLVAPDEQRNQLFSDYAVFLGVRVVFGLVVPVIATVMTWRTARIRSLDSATGLLYIVAALVLAGEIAARTLYFLTGIAT